MNRSEREKMLAGEFYDPSDAELLERWHLSKQLTKSYAAADSRDRDLLNSILRDLFGSVGSNVWVTAPIGVDYGNNIHIGDNVEINMGCVILDCNRVEIGDNSGIGPNVQIYAVTHPIDPTERIWQGGEGLSTWRIRSAPVIIGKNVWIGGGSIILAGVTIGDNTTIGAGSVVTKSIPANVLAAGNPCRVIKTLG